MLNPKNDRVDYSKMLKPPEGYVLDCAVGTTYSLSLETLVAASLPLALAETPEKEIAKNPIYLLTAIRKLSEKIVLFCEDGQLEFPKGTPSKLFQFCEKMLVRVDLKKKDERGVYASFHPKMWLLKFVNGEKDSVYRLIILSRNLTFSHNWDVCVSLEGHTEKKQKPDTITTPLGNFLGYLKGLIPGRSGSSYNNKKRNILEKLQTDIEKVCFSFDDTPWENVEFIPLGIGENSTDIKKYPPFCFDFKCSDVYKYDNLVVISPFISANFIYNLGDSSRKKKNSVAKMILCESELRKLKKEKLGAFANSVYVPKNKLIDGESSISEDGENSEDVFSQNIHAKVYFWQNESKKNLYLGSMNASNRGIGTNVELMLRMTTSNKTVTSKKIIEDLFGVDDKDSPFKKANFENSSEWDDEKEKNAAEKILKEFCRIERKAEVKKSGSKYSVLISFTSDKIDDRIQIEPLFGGKKHQKIRKNIVFDEMPLDCICDYYKISITYKDKKKIERLIVIETEGECFSIDERDTQIINSILKDADSLSKYLMLMFGDASDRLKIKNSIVHGKKGLFGLSSSDLGLYEQMLKISSQNVEIFRESKNIIDKIRCEDKEKEKIISLFNKFAESLLGKR